MSPLYESILGSLIRVLIGPLVVYANAHGVTITDSDTAKIVIDLVAVLGSAFWAIKKQVKQHRIINTAAAESEPTTVRDITQKVENGTFASARTPEMQIPEVTNNR